jgi:hypothetical protein
MGLVPPVISPALQARHADSAPNKNKRAGVKRLTAKHLRGDLAESGFCERGVGQFDRF